MTDRKCETLPPGITADLLSYRVATRTISRRRAGVAPRAALAASGSANSATQPSTNRPPATSPRASRERAPDQGRPSCASARAHRSRTPSVAPKERRAVSRGDGSASCSSIGSERSSDQRPTGTERRGARPARPHMSGAARPPSSGRISVRGPAMPFAVTARCASSQARPLSRSAGGGWPARLRSGSGARRSRCSYTRVRPARARPSSCCRRPRARGDRSCRRAAERGGAAGSAPARRGPRASLLPLHAERQATHATSPSGRAAGSSGIYSAMPDSTRVPTRGGSSIPRAGRSPGGCRPSVSCVPGAVCQAGYSARVHRRTGRSRAQPARVSRWMRARSGSHHSHSAASPSTVRAENFRAAPCLRLSAQARRRGHFHSHPLRQPRARGRTIPSSQRNVSIVAASCRAGRASHGRRRPGDRHGGSMSSLKRRARHRHPRSRRRRRDRADERVARRRDQRVVS